MANKSSNAPLAFNTNIKHPLHELPFLGKSQKKKIGLSFWNVPATGGYVGGCQTGEALAKLYLRSLTENSGSHCGTLQCIALDMFRVSDDDIVEMRALRGQAVGFFSELDRWLQTAAKRYCQYFVPLDKEKLLRAANDGLALSDAEWVATMEAQA